MQLERENYSGDHVGLENVGKAFPTLALIMAGFTVLLSTMPPQFIIPEQPTYGVTDVPTEPWYAGAMATVNSTFVAQDNETIYNDQFLVWTLDLAGIDVKARMRGYADTTIIGRAIRLSRLDTVFWIIPIEKLIVKPDGSYNVVAEDLERYALSSNLSRIQMHDEKITYVVSFGYDSSVFDNWREAFYGTDAYPNGEIGIHIGIGMQAGIMDVNVALFIFQFLTFTIPEIHPLLNLMFALPMWFGMAYVGFRVMLWIVSAPLGGGG